jgi:NADH-quinone oxidoreductase subunit C
LSSADREGRQEPDSGAPAPSADDVDDPGLQAEIANPEASNQPTGADAAPGTGTTAADEGPLPAPGAPGELSSDETPPQGEERGDAAPADDVAQVAGGDAGAPEATAAPAPSAPPSTTSAEPDPAPDAAVVPEQPPPTPSGAVREGAAAERAQAEKVARADQAAETVEEAEAPEVDEAAGHLLDTLRAKLGDDLQETHVAHQRDVWARVRVEAWRRAAEVCRDELGLTYFCYVSAIDWMPSPYGRSEEPAAADESGDGADARDPDESPATIEHGFAGGETRFQLLARLVAPLSSVAVTLKADVADDDLRAPSWVGVYAGADWHERETWEMYGITFDGHPNLIHLYLPGAFEGHPLRKDFPLLSREVKPWPGLVDVEAMPGEGEAS